MPIMQRRTLISSAMAAAAAGTLSACGFALRKAPEFAFSTLYSGLPESSPLGVELRRSLNATRKVRVISDVRQLSEAQVVLDVLVNQREKVVLSTNSNGQVREFQLRLRFRFKLRTLGGKELIPDTELLLQREINFSETLALANEQEEALLYRDMQSDIVQQLIRRLAAVTNEQLA
jgi:LPS-assembly lipoprotein